MTLRVRILTYVGILLALIVLYVLGIIFGPQRAIPVPLVPGLEAEAITRIEVSAESEIVLERADGQRWDLRLFGRTFPARSERVASFLEAIARARALRIVTRNEALWAEFGVEDGARVALHTQESPALAQSYTFVWGHSSPEPGLSFVRVEGDDEVVATDAELGFFLQQPTAYWSYLRFFPEDISPEDVIAVTASASTGRWSGYAVERRAHEEDDQWVSVYGMDAGGTEAGKAVDTAIITELVRDLVNLVGMEFAPNQSGISPGEETARITFELADGRGYQVRVVAGASDYRAQAFGPNLPTDEYGTVVYLLNRQTVEQLFSLEGEYWN